MLVLLAEDNDLQAEEMLQQLGNEFADVQFERISSEYEFRQVLDHHTDFDPAVVMIDVMLEWSDVLESGEYPEPPEVVLREMHYRAGLRCVDGIRERQAWPAAPIILFSVLDKVDVFGDPGEPNRLVDTPSGVTFAQKTPSGTELIVELRSALRSRFG